jgi:hypothetical protein
MLPALWPGDIVYLNSIRIVEVVAGQIVLFMRDGRLFLHRVCRPASLNSEVLLTHGDALPNLDPPVSSSELLGSVVRVERAGREFVPCLPTSLDRLLSRLARHSSVVVSLLLRFHSAWLDSCAERFNPKQASA